MINTKTLTILCYACLLKTPMLVPLAPRMQNPARNRAHYLCIALFRLLAVSLLYAYVLACLSGFPISSCCCALERRAQGLCAAHKSRKRLLQALLLAHPLLTGPPAYSQLMKTVSLTQYQTSSQAQHLTHPTAPASQAHPTTPSEGHLSQGSLMLKAMMSQTVPWTLTQSQA